MLKMFIKQPNRLALIVSYQGLKSRGMNTELQDTLKRYLCVSKITRVSHEAVILM